MWEHHSNKVGLSAGSEAKRRSLNTEMCLEELADDFRFNMAGSKNLQTKITFTKKRHFGGSSWSKPKILTMNEMGLWKCYPVLKKSDFKIIELYNSGVTKIDDIAADDDVTVKKASIYNKIKEFQRKGLLSEQDRQTINANAKRLRREVRRGRRFNGKLSNCYCSRLQ